MSEIRTSNKIIVGRPEGNRPVGRNGCRSEDSIKIDLKDILCEDVNWIHLPQDRVQRPALVNSITNIRNP
jgi:hypothetical protein